MPKNIKIDIQDLVSKTKMLPETTEKTLEENKDTIYKLNSISDAIFDMAESYQEAAATILTDEELKMQEKSNIEIFLDEFRQNLDGLEDNMLYEDMCNPSDELMDARSIAATAANKGFLTAATDMDVEYKNPKYFFDKTIYENRVFDSHGVADPSVEIKFGPNIKDWPAMEPLPENLLLKVVSEIHDPVTTTDELIPSGETSSFRSNPIGLAEFTLSRKDPAYVGRAKEVKKAEEARVAGNCPAEAFPELKPVMDKIKESYKISRDTIAIGSTIFAVKPGDGSAREQAASCQKVLGGWANIANEYATKRYRSNLINWGMLPFIIKDGELPFANGDYIFVPGIVDAIRNKDDVIKAYVVGDSLKEFELTVGDLTDDERQIILDGCLINFYRNN